MTPRATDSSRAIGPSVAISPSVGAARVADPAVMDRRAATIAVAVVTATSAVAGTAVAVAATATDVVAAVVAVVVVAAVFARGAIDRQALARLVTGPIAPLDPIVRPRNRRSRSRLVPA